MYMPKKIFIYKWVGKAQPKGTLLTTSCLLPFGGALVNITKESSIQTLNT